jgi:hydrogenase maturation factor
VPVLVPNVESRIPSAPDGSSIDNSVADDHLIRSTGDTDSAPTGVDKSIVIKPGAVGTVVGDQAAARAAVAPGDVVIASEEARADPEVY